MPADRKSTDKASLAAAASDQIRAIVAAAEQAAAQIREAAEQEASRIRAQAEEEAAGIRTQAGSDVRALLESIRTGLSRLQGDIDLLEEKLAPRPAASGPARASPARAAAHVEAPPAPTAELTDSDMESARLVALNMALSGAQREEVDRYLSENFALANRDALLDEVYDLAGS